MRLEEEGRSEHYGNALVVYLDNIYNSIKNAMITTIVVLLNKIYPTLVGVPNT